MSQAIWILRYHLTNGAEQQYLNWFHTVHIPEKLARPGYLWAAHYEGQMVPFNQNENTKSYLALFGGTSTRTFLDPSPSELRGMQDDLTKEMMTKRHSSQGAVFAFEWCANGSGEVQQPKSRQLDYFSISANGNDEAIGAWAAKNLFSMVQKPDFNGSKTYKLIGVTGGQYHGILHEHSPLQTSAANEKDFRPQNSEFLKDLAVEHFTGQRIWPNENGQ